MSSPTAVRRFILIDSIRGLAALAVACFHFYNQLDSTSADGPLWGSAVQAVMTHGDLGVFVFFVLSGFVIACSLHRVRIDGTVVGKFALRRSLRLDPAYWSVIWVTVLLGVAVKSRGLLANQPLAGPWDVLANMTYLDNLLGCRSIVKVGWTLCLEIQFYLVFVLCGWLICTLGGGRSTTTLRALVFGPLTLASLLVFTGVLRLEQPGLFVPYWFMYFLGVVIWWVHSKDVPGYWLALALAASLAVSWKSQSPAAWVATATGGGIYWAGRTGRIDTLLAGGLFRYLGRISYSFYLMHPLAGTNFIRVVQRIVSPNDPLHPLVAALVFLGAVLVSVMAAQVLYWLVEAPSHRFSRRIRWSTAGGDTSPGTVTPLEPAEEALSRPAPTIESAAAAGSRLAPGLLARLGGLLWRERRWLALTLLLALVWAAELYAVQSATLVYPNEVSARFLFWATKIRLALDLLFIGALVLVLRPRPLAVVIVGAFLAYLGLVTYHHYFLKPLSFSTLTGNWREGVSLSGFALDLFPKVAALLLAVLLVVKLAIVALRPRCELSRRARWSVAGAMAIAYCGLYAVANRIDPLDAIQTTRGVGRLGEIRGYLGPWFAEWYYLHDDRMLSAALERRKRVYDRLNGVEADIPVHDKIVFLQAESFDTNVIGYTVNGQEVTPFLNRLREVSMYYRVRAVHSNGSSDADFAALNGVIGSEHVNTYTIPGYPYVNTTPQGLARSGFDVFAFHGNSGEFYNRRQPFEQMGFSGLFFREEMEGRYGLRADNWGVRDRDVLALSSQMLRTATRPTCHFVITLTTHVPYTMLTGADNEIFPQPRNVVERYLNNMRYLDNCLRDYIVSLGKGVTVVIYADHPTEEGNETFQPDRDGAREYIPCFIYDTDRDLSKLQRTRRQPRSTDGSLNLVDVINFVRGQVARNHPITSAQAADR